MKEYIERGKLFNTREIAISVYENANIFNVDAIRDGLKPLLDKIVDVPSADVKEVVHGKWVDAYPILEPHPMFVYGICSECGAKTGTISNYCHNCGAKMDLKLELTEYEKKCLFCKHNYKPLNCVPKCNCMCENYSDFELIDNIKERFKW